MFEYHGWITVQGSAGDDDESDLKAAYGTVESEIESFSGATSLVNLRWVNGLIHLHLSGFLNHRQGEGQAVLDLFHRVAEVASGSYGTLYVRDDEDRDGKSNEFQVFVMRRGDVTIHADRFLSPCIPVIEDEDG